MPPTIPVVRHRLSPTVRHLPHLVFLLPVAGTLVRLVELDNEVCWRVAPVIAALGLLYIAGPARWDRFGVAGRPVWLGTLMLLWAWVSWQLPVSLAFAYTWLAVPLAVLALRMPGRRVAATALGAITAGLLASLVRIGGGVDLDVLAPPLAAVGATVVLYRSQQRLNSQLAATRGELAKRQRDAGRLAERTRIARDLHDTLAQELAGSRMLLQAAERDWERNPDAALRQVRAVSQALGAHLEETRSIISDLTPPALERDGLETALRDLCTRPQPSTTAPHVAFHTEGRPLLLPTERAVTLLRVAQGLLANAREHAQATHVHVTLTYEDGGAAIEVRDDGRGFDQQTTHPIGPDRGFGLAAARERLKAIGGTLTLDSAPGCGTRVRAMLPAADRVLAGTP
ncbi:sensor histidine kinase [Streptomyces sp. A012304]|uniref:sensor histidine kinase n=1 Tax=Streptomyces sp. A012304 TaxID=375446 RepID=UPI00222E5B71|nr:sensor histidine kinase [Streptomyces sp. A012304]GKQ34852.1 two-component sensor histidine kinase [Streptomyces sp. A012304]